MAVQILCGSKLSPAALRRLAVGRLKDAPPEPLADQATLAVAAVRIETVSDDPTAVAHDIGDDGHQTRRHLERNRYRRCGSVKRDRLGDLTHVDDAHGNPPGAQVPGRRRV